MLKNQNIKEKQIPIQTQDHSSGIIEARSRIIIENVSPDIDGGIFPAKRSLGEKAVIQASIYIDGHDQIDAELLYRPKNQETWKAADMKNCGNDRWVGDFVIEDMTPYVYTIRAWMNEFETWKKDLVKKKEAAQDLTVEFMVGAQLLLNASLQAKGPDKERLADMSNFLNKAGSPEAYTVACSNELTGLMKVYGGKKSQTACPKELQINVDSPKALFSSWYELFPRSWSPDSHRHGTFADCERLLPEIARMGFDVLYLAPIHPIGHSHRKGKNNSITCEENEPGSPWAIGSAQGGHKSIHPELGTLDDYKKFLKKAKEHSIDVAFDLAFQCSPDHPYVKEHPQWFKWRPDGTVQYAENPPKKYQDILPINFDSEDRENLWAELKSIVVYWIEQGVKIFRVDNPHTKPFVFWDWLIKEIRGQYPEVIFLAEAFTRPQVMYRLAKGGFNQSYTYFTWRNSKKEFMDYMTELIKTQAQDFYRPNFWVNTPDILPEHLQYGGRSAFMMRLVLAATLSASYGMYGPAFELCVAEAVAGKEEYLNSEKYEIKHWDWDAPGNLKDFVARVNQARKENAALQTTWNLKFCDVDNPNIIAYYKATDDQSNIILVVVNLDPHHTQSGWIRLPLCEMNIEPGRSFLAHDLLSSDKYIWQGESNYIELNAKVCPAHILKIFRRVHREQDFDYFM